MMMMMTMKGIRARVEEEGMEAGATIDGRRCAVMRRGVRRITGRLVTMGMDLGELGVCVSHLALLLSFRPEVVVCEMPLLFTGSELWCRTSYCL